ncbi:hypothetical protein ACFX15_034823 [Malus domestica]|uniref:xyloglucan endotransglucosylase/hydrolase protein 2-like n=1 Tax=Malus domestica TaxID=3750 RepID=UPI003975488F
MDFPVLGFLVLILQLVGGMLARDNIFYDENYEVNWGFDHFKSLYRGREVELSLDNSSGAGFISKLSYGSGFFHMRIRLPEAWNTADVCTTFYLTSGDEPHQDELDFELLGSKPGGEKFLLTNVFIDGQGGREETMTFWFDPTTEYHDYQILWNHHQIVFYVDKFPIRIFKNNKKFGVPYISKPMKIQASLWNAEWATRDADIDWRYAPFKAHYEGFDVNGCTPQNSIKDCYGHRYWWNSRKHWELDSNERQKYEDIRRFLVYDYCSAGFPRKPECDLNG